MTDTEKLAAGDATIVQVVRNMHRVIAKKDAEITRLKEQHAEYKRKVWEALDDVETCLDGWPGQSVVRYADVVAALKGLED